MEQGAQSKAVNFKDVVNHLQSEGWTQRQLAEWAGMSHGRIARLALDATTEPRFNAGSALLSLLTPVAHLRLTGYARRYKGTTRGKPPAPA